MQKATGQETNKTGTLELVFKKDDDNPSFEKLAQKVELRIVCCTNEKQQSTEKYEKSALSLIKLYMVRQEDFKDYSEPEEYSPGQILQGFEYNPTGDKSNQLALKLPSNLDDVSGGSITIMQGAFRPTGRNQIIFLTTSTCVIRPATQDYIDNKVLNKQIENAAKEDTERLEAVIQLDSDSEGSP